MRRVVVVGGAGRIGQVVAARLLAQHPDLSVTITSRDPKRGEKVASRLGARAVSAPLDLSDGAGLRNLVSGASLVIHTAGPFQSADPLVLQAAIDCGVGYLDIADDLEFARKARQLPVQARAAKVAAIVNGGVFPGMSNIMAGLLCERGPAQRLSFSYFIAGSGGSGPAVMASTFLLGTRPASEFVRGEWVGRQAFTGGVATEFLAPVGRRTCYSIELPETTSCYEIYKIPNISARFATSPGVWNHATRWTCTLLKPWLSHRQRVASFVTLLLPLIRVIDRFVGAAIAMDVAVESADGQIQRLRYVHASTMESIAQAVTAQAEELLLGRVSAGVHFPEEAIRDKERHLQRAAVGGVLLPGS